MAMRCAVVLFVAFSVCHSQSEDEFQRYDGWYNNLLHASLGTIQSALIYRAPPAYSDGVYQPAGRHRPPPGVLSSKLLGGPDALPVTRDLNAFFAFFGQAVSGEILSTVSSGDISCPPEVLPFEIGEYGTCERTNTSGLQCDAVDTRISPFFRVPFDKRTGWHVNAPRQAVNHVTSFIDGSFVYGTQTPQVDVMRSFSEGELKHVDTVPERNKLRSPLLNPPPPAQHPHLFSPERLYMAGSLKVNQEPDLLSVSILLHRYHNFLAKQLANHNPKWSDERLFQRARRILIAAWQSIVMYEFAPLFMGIEQMKNYSGYKPYVDPSMSVEFQAAAYRFGHSLIPSGFYVRDANCNFTAIPLCKVWWDSTTVVDKHGVESIVRGSVSQRMEAGDHIHARGVKDDLFGGMRMTHRDLPALNIQRGREQGLADYNTVRRAFGLPAVEQWRDINPELHEQKPQLFEMASLLYNDSLDDIDLYVGGLLESSGSVPGPTFRAILEDQFLRIRDGDRFWFENTQNGLFTAAEIEGLRSFRMSDIIRAVVNDSVDPSDPLFQENIFVYDPSLACEGQSPQLDGDKLEKCNPPQSYDFFKGSEISFTVSFVVLGCLPILTVLVCFVLVARRASQNKAVFKAGPRSTRRLRDTFIAQEYDGPVVSKKVQVKLGSGRSIQVLNRQASCVRNIDLTNMDSLVVRISFYQNKAKEFGMLLKVPKEYDLVLMFSNIQERTEFQRALRVYCGSIHLHLDEQYVSMMELLAIAVTNSQREAVLKTFFRTAFDQVFHAKRKQRHRQTVIDRTDSAVSTEHAKIQLRVPTTPRKQRKPSLSSMMASNSRQSVVKGKASSLLSIELNSREFAQALQLRPDSLFVTQMFLLADKDRNGYISYPEFLDVLVMLSRGSLEAKMRMLFDMYDSDSSDDLDPHEFKTMIKSLMDMANRDISKDDIDSVVYNMLRQGGLEHKASLTFDDFYGLVERHRKLIWNEELLEENRVLSHKRAPRYAKRKGPEPKVQRQESDVFGEPVVLEREQRTWTQNKWTALSYYMENNWNHILIAFLFCAICCWIFLAKYIEYCYLREHTGLRQIAGAGPCVSRGSAAVLSFTFAILLLSVCRNLITMLRDTAIGYYIPFDSSISLHRLAALVSLPFIVAHVVGHGINFYQVGTQPPAVIWCVFPEFMFASDFLPSFHYWLYLTVPGLTGVVLVVLLVVMYVFATAYSRQHIYKAFWFTHRLFPLVYALTIIHGSYRLLQPPFFWMWVVGPLVLYVIDLIISMRRSGVALKIINVELLPSDVLHLSFKQPASVQFHSGQWARLCCAAISNREFHPFTITSAGHEKELSFYIRAVGPFTRSLQHIFAHCRANMTPYPEMYLHGPYGSSHQDWYKFEVAVLVGGGIGVTPHASVLKDLVHKVYKQQSEVATRRVYFVWLARTHTQFEWFLDILHEVEELDVNQLIQMDIFITQLVKDFDIRTTMLYICEHQFQRICNCSLFTGLRATTHFGRIDFEKYLYSVARRNASLSKLGVFACGPKSMVRSVDSACEANNLKGHLPTLVAHREIF